MPLIPGLSLPLAPSERGEGRQPSREPPLLSPAGEGVRGEGSRLVVAHADHGLGRSVTSCPVRIVARNGDQIRKRERDATAPRAFLYLLSTPSQTLRAGLLLRGALGCAGARVPDGGGALHRPPPPWPGLGIDPGRRRDPARGLPAEYRSDGGCQLLGSHARDQYRDRDAPQELRPPPEAVVPLLRQPEDRAPGGTGDEGFGGDRRGRPPRSGRSLRRGNDLRRRVRSDVRGQP